MNKFRERESYNTTKLKDKEPHFKYTVGESGKQIISNKEKEYEEMEVLLNSGNIPEITEFLMKNNTKSMNSGGKNALHLILENSNLTPYDKLSFTQQLLKNKININLADKKNGYTPLHIAVEQQLGDTVQLLLDKNANVNKLTLKNKNALHIALIPTLKEYSIEALDTEQDVSDHKIKEYNEIVEMIYDKIKDLNIVNLKREEVLKIVLEIYNIYDITTNEEINIEIETYINAKKAHKKAQRKYINIKKYIDIHKEYNNIYKEYLEEDFKYLKEEKLEDIYSFKNSSLYIYKLKLFNEFLILSFTELAIKYYNNNIVFENEYDKIIKNIIIIIESLKINKTQLLNIFYKQFIILYNKYLEYYSIIFSKIDFTTNIFSKIENNILYTNIYDYVNYKINSDNLIHEFFNQIKLLLPNIEQYINDIYYLKYNNNYDPNDENEKCYYLLLNIYNAYKYCINNIDEYNNNFEVLVFTIKIMIYNLINVKYFNNILKTILKDFNKIIYIFTMKINNIIIFNNILNNKIYKLLPYIYIKIIINDRNIEFYKPTIDPIHKKINEDDYENINNEYNIYMSLIDNNKQIVISIIDEKNKYYEIEEQDISKYFYKDYFYYYKFKWIKSWLDKLKKKEPFDKQILVSILNKIYGYNFKKLIYSNIKTIFKEHLAPLIKENELFSSVEEKNLFFEEFFSSLYSDIRSDQLQSDIILPTLKQYPHQPFLTYPKYKKKDYCFIHVLNPKSLFKSPIMAGGAHLTDTQNILSYNFNSFKEKASRVLKYTKEVDVLDNNKFDDNKAFIAKAIKSIDECYELNISRSTITDEIKEALKNMQLNLYITNELKKNNLKKRLTYIKFYYSINIYKYKKLLNISQIILNILEESELENKNISDIKNYMKKIIEEEEDDDEEDEDEDDEEDEDEEEEYEDKMNRLLHDAKDAEKKANEFKIAADAAEKEDEAIELNNKATNAFKNAKSFRKKALRIFLKFTAPLRKKNKAASKAFEETKNSEDEETNNSENEESQDSEDEEESQDSDNENKKNFKLIFNILKTILNKYESNKQKNKLKKTALEKIKEYKKIIDKTVDEIYKKEEEKKKDKEVSDRLYDEYLIYLHDTYDIVSYPKFKYYDINLEIINKLIDKINLSQKDTDGMTPLFYALKHNLKHVVEILLKKKKGLLYHKFTKKATISYITEQIVETQNNEPKYDELFKKFIEKIIQDSIPLYKELDSIKYEKIFKFVVVDKKISKIDKFNYYNIVLYLFFFLKDDRKNIHEIEKIISELLLSDFLINDQFKDKIEIYLTEWKYIEKIIKHRDSNYLKNMYNILLIILGINNLKKFLDSMLPTSILKIIYNLQIENFAFNESISNIKDLKELIIKTCNQYLLSNIFDLVRNIII